MRISPIHFWIGGPTTFLGPTLLPGPTLFSAPLHTAAPLRTATPLPDMWLRLAADLLQALLVVVLLEYDLSVFL